MAISLPYAWKAREYQRGFMNYMFEGGEFPYEKRAIEVWHRRSGKDSCFINTLAVASQMRVGTYWHLLPSLNQGRRVVWNGVDGQSRRVIYQAFPREIIESVNENDMLIKLKNGSFYQVVGSDNYDALVGTNPLGVGFSEWALADPSAWNFIRPILAENGGFAMFNTTPRGKNHAYQMYQTAKASPNWHTSLLTVNDTRRDDGSPVVSQKMIEMEREEGVSEEIINQEYYCSWEGINQGSIYGRLLNKFQDTNQIIFPEPYNPMLPVYTAWDLGRRDATAVWFYQIVQGEIHIVDFDQGTGMGAEEWLEKLRHEYDYPLGTPTLPHDSKAKTFAARYTAWEQFEQAGYTPYLAPRLTLEQGINATRAVLPFTFFNIGNVNVRKGLNHLSSYQYEYDEKTKTFNNKPKHDHNSHPADAFRMLAVAQNVIKVANKNRNTSVIPNRHRMNTPMGMAVNLQSLFEEREAALSLQHQRI